MPPVPFREMYTLSDAVEQIGRRLYGETWTSREYMYSDSSKSPDEIASERMPLEEEIKRAEEEIVEIDAEIRKTLNEETIRQLANHRGKLENRAAQLHTSLELYNPLNDTIVAAYNACDRAKVAKDTLIVAILEFKLQVHDGRGRQLNPFVWSDPRFCYDLGLSIVVNPRSSGEPRRQAARIDKEPFTNWLATLTPRVEAPHAPSPEEKLKEFLRQLIASSKGQKTVKKVEIQRDAIDAIPGVTVRMFNGIWGQLVPQEWRNAGAPKSRQSV